MPEARADGRLGGTGARDEAHANVVPVRAVARSAGGGRETLAARLVLELDLNRVGIHEIDERVQIAGRRVIADTDRRAVIVDEAGRRRDPRRNLGSHLLLVGRSDGGCLAHRTERVPEEEAREAGIVEAAIEVELQVGAADACAQTSRRALGDSPRGSVIQADDRAVGPVLRLLVERVRRVGALRVMVGHDQDVLTQVAEQLAAGIGERKVVLIVNVTVGGHRTARRDPRCRGHVLRVRRRAVEVLGPRVARPDLGRRLEVGAVAVHVHVVDDHSTRGRVPARAVSGRNAIVERAVRLDAEHHTDAGPGRAARDRRADRAADHAGGRKDHRRSTGSAETEVDRVRQITVHGIVDTALLRSADPDLERVDRLSRTGARHEVRSAERIRREPAGAARVARRGAVQLRAVGEGNRPRSTGAVGEVPVHELIPLGRIARIGRADRDARVTVVVVLALRVVPVAGIEIDRSVRIARDAKTAPRRTRARDVGRESRRNRTGVRHRGQVVLVPHAGETHTAVDATGELRARR